MSNVSRQVTVYVKDTPVTFTTTLTYAEAWKRLAEFTMAGGPLANSSFAKDLLANGKKYGLSEKQRNWVVKLVHDAINPVATPQVKADTFAGILTLFTAAKQHLKFPKIWLQVGTQQLRLGVAGNASKYPGAVNVTDGVFNGTWFGRINTDGTFTPSKALTPEVAKILEQLAADPVKTAADFGKLTGRCCFCNKALKDEKSTAVGYGPVCAKKFNLPWGKLTPADLAKVTFTAEKGEETEEYDADDVSPEAMAWRHGKKTA
jgi:hypothetical protein